MYFDSNNDDDVNEGEYHVPAIRNNNVNDEADENYNYITDTDQYGNEARARRPYSLLQRNSPSPPPIPQSFAQSQKKKKTAKTKDGKENFLWKDDNVYYLCNKWQEPVLYDIKNKYYYDKTKRGLAVDRIWDGMSAMEFNPLPSKENIVEQLNGLRTYYNAPESGE